MVQPLPEAALALEAGWSSWWQCWVSLSSWGAVTIVCSRKMGLASSHHGQQGERWDGNLGPSVERRESALATIFHVAPKINFAQDSLIYYYSTKAKIDIKYRKHRRSYCSTHSIVCALGYFDPKKYFFKAKITIFSLLCESILVRMLLCAENLSLLFVWQWKHEKATWK